MKHIAHIYTDLPEKFGVPRQAGLAGELLGRIIFEPEYRVKEAFRGLEDFSHIWILWEFSEVTAKRAEASEEASETASDWSPTVRPPRLGGNRRMGVFATRSPFRPNPIGLSAVKIESIELDTPEGPVITVSGIDMMSGTPIYDIKPYIPYADIRADAKGSYATENSDYHVEVSIDESYRELLGSMRYEALREVLAQDPRPSYKAGEDREYGMSFAGFEVRFRAENNRITVIGIEKPDA